MKASTARPLKRAPAAFMVIAACTTLTAFTQEAQKRKDIVIEEVIVTAQRRAESLQDVAISMTVLNQEDIANANMSNTNDLAALTPSLSTNTRFGAENASFSVRGFTQSLRTTASVGVYFAEVVAPRGQSSQTSGDGAGPGVLFDLQNVQVLKGPQGTLFGRNTTGGAILLVPNKPADVFEGFAEISGGNFEMRQEKVVVNVPLHERIKLRLGMDKKEREGHLDNFGHVGAEKLGDVDYTAGRVSLVFNITDSLENYTIVNYSDSNTNGYTSQLFVCNPDPDVASNPALAITAEGCQRQLAQQQAAGEDDFYDLVSTVPEPSTNIEDLRVINTTTWDLTSTITLKNILAYSHLETENESDIFGTQYTETQATFLGLGLPGGVSDPNREFAVGISLVDPNIPVTSQEAVVEEMQIQGVSFDGRLDWQGGVYYEHSEPDGFSGNNSVGLLSCEFSTVKPADPSQFNCFDFSGGVLGSVLGQDLKTEYRNKAVYAQSSYDIFEWLTATLGLRYTWDNTRGYGIKTRYTFVGNVQQDPIIQVTTPKQSSEAPTGLLELKYRPLANAMVYAKYVRGYRQGSVNLAADPGLDTHDHETVDNYEIGAKAEFGGPVPGRISVAAFDNELRDMQLQFGYISSTSGPTTAITNAGRAEIKGYEAEAFFKLLEDLSLSLSYSMLNTELIEQGNINRQKVEEAVTAASGNSVSGQLAAQTATPIADEGDELPFSPESAWTVSLNYRLPLPADFGTVNIGGTYIYTGERRVAASSSGPFGLLEEYSLINYNASWRAIVGSGFDLSLFATNVRDEEYTTYVSGTFNTLGFESRQVGLPKMFGARLRYNFGAD